MKKVLKAKTFKIKQISNDVILEIFNLYSRYYENISMLQFEKDLKAKDRIIILRNNKKEIKGFSTLLEFKTLKNGKNVHVLYSGDTIIDSDYWGSAALTMEFLKNIIKAKLKNPHREVWWYLISKGYKTYLLLANNFATYFPRYDVLTPKVEKDFIIHLSEKLFPGKLNIDSLVLEFQKSEHEKLKAFVAPITDDLARRYPKIDFFQKSNPDWENGNELACIGKVEFKLGFLHPLKVFKKGIHKVFLKSRISQTEKIPK